MEEDIEKDIITIISEVSGFEPEEIVKETDLVNELDVDSIKAIEIMVAIEKKYKISIRDDDIAKINTVREVLDLTQKVLNEKET